MRRHGHGSGHDSGLEACFGIDAELEQRVKAQAATFQAANRRTVEESWKLGGELRAAKSRVRHGSGFRGSRAGSA